MTDPAVSLLTDSRCQPQTQGREQGLHPGGALPGASVTAAPSSKWNDLVLSPFSVCSQCCRGWICCPCPRQAPDCPGAPESTEGQGHDCRRQHHHGLVRLMVNALRALVLHVFYVLFIWEYLYPALPSFFIETENPREDKASVVLWQYMT